METLQVFKHCPLILKPLKSEDGSQIGTLGVLCTRKKGVTEKEEEIGKWGLMEVFANQSHQVSVAQGQTPYMLWLINDLESSKKEIFDIFRLLSVYWL